MKNYKGKGYVWQRPNKAEILLACVGMRLRSKEVLEVYEFCGFSLSHYERYDEAFRRCLPFVHKGDWVSIVSQYRFFTSETIYDYHEDRKKIYVNSGEKW